MGKSGTLPPSRLKWLFTTHTALKKCGLCRRVTAPRTTSHLIRIGSSSERGRNGLAPYSCAQEESDGIWEDNRIRCRRDGMATIRPSTDDLRTASRRECRSSRRRDSRSSSGSESLFLTKRETRSVRSYPTRKHRRDFDRCDLAFGGQCLAPGGGHRGCSPYARFVQR